jgi:hypothetical protein
MHYPGHIREAFTDWIYDGRPDMAIIEVDYEERQFPAEHLLLQLWRCTDIMPGHACEEFDIPRGSTYASAAQAEMRRRRNRASSASLRRAS